jgi:hypothetical protein
MATLQDLADAEAIKTLSAIYARGLDRFNTDEVMKPFAVDAIFDASPCGLDSCMGAAAIRNFFAHNQEVMRDQIHLFGNFVIDLDGLESAHGTNYLWQDGHLKDGSRVHSVIFNQDVYVKRKGSWYIAKRVVSPLMPLQGMDDYAE